MQKTITVNDLNIITPSSFQDIEKRISKKFRHLFRDRIPETQYLSILSEKLSSHILKILDSDAENKEALEAAFNRTKLRAVYAKEWAQKDATLTALGIFGLTKKDMDRRRHEDNVIRADAASLLGHADAAPDNFGRTVYEKKDERMTIYYTNMMPLEEMLGVDLIYVNETKGSVVMLQYKMLETEESSGDRLARMDKQLDKEIGRMKIPSGIMSDDSDFRLNSSPFYFKFVDRYDNDSTIKAFIISLEHLKLYLSTPQAKGIKGGIRVSYKALDGSYLRKTGFIELVKSGYIGTHKSETDVLAKIIDHIAETGDQDVVLAWQEKIEQDEDENEEYQKNILKKIVKSRNSTN